MRIRWATKDLLIKIVYYGPPLAGKTTNLQKLQELIPSSRRSDLVSLDTEGDRTLFFDLMEVSLGKIGGLTPRVSVYTVPGQPRYKRVREVVLRGADGIVFVADSAADRLRENLAIWYEMLNYMKAMRLCDSPVLLQMNKQDLPNSLRPSQMQGLFKRPGKEVPSIAAEAFQGKGVKETFSQILSLVVSGGRKS